MNKKIIFGIIIVILAIIMGLLIFNGQLNNDNNMKVGDTNFILPDGYSVSEVIKSGDANITNGTNSLGIIENNGSNIQKYIDKYVEKNKDRNYTTKINNFNIGGIEVYKSEIVENNETFHYWFVNNDKVYEIFTWDGNNQTDDVVFDLVKSTKT